jgi:cytochrome c553
LLSFLIAAASVATAQAIEYNRDVRPILVQSCFACHGPDSAARQADLRLDLREAAVEAGALEPGKPDESELIRRVFSTDADEVMPPPDHQHQLTAEQKDLLRRWVAAGAEYQSHWSFIAPRRPPLPAVKKADWVRNPIDAFVLAQLEQHGLEPAPEADRRTLARRLSLDLTGLPPEPQLVEAFVEDVSEDAYERLVDRLLQSERWGEHRGRYWLDAARYADTHGIHFDNFREIWAYRDWVIDALNRNLPFDRFTIEQLAGDLLPDPTLDQRIATGFHRCNITTNEGGVIPEEYAVLYTRDRTETTSWVWMGLTMNCATCHDHKFDPVTQREFYELAAFFNNTTQSVMDGNIKDTPPVLMVPPPEDRARWDELGPAIAAAKQQQEQRRAAARADFDRVLAETPLADLAPAVPADELIFHAPLNDGPSDRVAVSVAGQSQSIALPTALASDVGHVAPTAYKASPGVTIEVPEAGDFDKDQGFSFGAWVKLDKADAGGALLARMDDQNMYRGWDLWFENGRPGTHLIHRWDEDALKVVANEPLKAGQWSHVLLTYDGSGKAGGVKIFVNGQPQAVRVQKDQLKGTIRTDVPLKVAQRSTQSRMDGVLVQDLRLYGRALSPSEVAQIATGTRIAYLAAKPADQRSQAETDEVFAWWLAAKDEPYREAAGKVAALEQEQAAIRGRSTVAHVQQERDTPPMAHVLFRGEYDQRRDQVGPDTPDVLPPMPPELPRNRLGLAQWLLQPDHPLTARVTVNRFWQEVFGTGLVRTAEDFGITGELPSHPELLDWLAVEFRESGWDIKGFFKLLVTSATYRQSAVATPDKLELDADNRLLSRGPRFRVDAEVVRDYALAASGLLSPKIGGPSVKPYQPDGVWEAVAMIGSNTRNYQRDAGENLYRRSMYTFWKRSAPPAAMDVFNAPSREVCAVRRERTNTPLQALVTLNDPQFVEAARHLAQLVLVHGGDSVVGRLDYLAKRLLCRPLDAAELPVVQASLADLSAHYKANAEDARQLLAVGESQPDPSLDVAELAAWTMLANQMMNLDEVLCK